MRVRAVARALAADRQPSPEEADGRGPARPRAARQVGVLLDQRRGGGEARRPRRPEGGGRCRQMLLTGCARRCGSATRPRRGRSPRTRARAAAGAARAAQTAERRSFGEALYSAEQRGELPEAAALASLGCGNPTAVAELREGETVLDLGSGGGIDVILSARRVGPTGHRVRAGHDRRDAGAGPPERRRGRRARTRSSSRA